MVVDRAGSRDGGRADEISVGFRQARDAPHDCRSEGADGDLAISADGTLIAGAGTSAITVWETGHRPPVSELSRAAALGSAGLQRGTRTSGDRDGGRQHLYKVFATDSWSEVATPALPDGLHGVVAFSRMVN